MVNCIITIYKRTAFHIFNCNDKKVKKRSVWDFNKGVCVATPDSSNTPYGYL